MIHGRFPRAIWALAVVFSASAFATDFPAVPGEYVVKLKSQPNVMAVGALESSLGARIDRTISDDLRLVLVKRPIIETSDSAVRSLATNSAVEYAEPNYIYRVSGYRTLAGSAALPNDPELGRLWGMSNTGQAVPGDYGTVTGQAGVDIDAVRAWQVETGTRNVVVAVIDTGVNWQNADLAANIFTNAAEANGQAGVDDDGNGYVDDIHGYDFARKDADPMDVYGHGTHCAGTIGAVGNDGQGVVGVAWNVTLLPIRFLGDDGGGTLADAVSSIQYATRMKANIMSNSWGGGGFSQALLDAINQAKDANILFIAAAGNDGNDNDANPTYPASYDTENMLAVAALDPAGRIASFSNWGKTKVHIGAPGVNVLSHTMRGLESWSGTSMATPHVAGVAALLYSQDLTQTFSQVKNRILTSARPVSGMRNRVVTSGMVNAYLALTNQTAPADPSDPFNWQKDAQTASTAHPYTANFRQEFTFKVPGASRVSVYFSRFETEASYDKVEFKDAAGNVVGNMSGRLGEAFGPVVNGDTVTMIFTSDGSVQQYGFDVGGIAYQ